MYALSAMAPEVLQTLLHGYLNWKKSERERESEDGHTVKVGFSSGCATTVRWPLFDLPKGLLEQRQGSNACSCFVQQWLKVVSTPQVLQASTPLVWKLGTPTWNRSTWQLLALNLVKKALQYTSHISCKYTLHISKHYIFQILLHYIWLTKFRNMRLL